MIYKFDNYSINTKLREFYASDEVVEMEPKVYDLLLYFVENPQKVVTKDELLDSIWSGVTVSETALTRAIMKARKVLGNESDEYLQTVRGHGYKFLAEITKESDEQPATDSNLNHPTSQSSLIKRSNWQVFLAFVLIVFISGLGYFLIPKDNAFSDESNLAILPFVNNLSDEELSWASLGLMSLATQVVKSRASMTQVSEWETSKEEFEFESIDLTKQQVEDIKLKLNANYLVLSQLDEDPTGIRLTYSVYHPKGAYENNVLVGKNPTALTQQMALEISQRLPGYTTSISTDLVISDDEFTNELYSRGMSNLLQGYSDKAFKYISLTIEQAPQLFVPRYQLAIVKREQNKLQESEDDLLKLINDFEDFKANKSYKILALNELGKSHQLQDELEEAKSVYEQAYAMAISNKNLKNQSVVAHSLGSLYEKLEDDKKAMEWLTTSEVAYQKIYSKPNPDNIYLQGKIDTDVGNIDKAEIHFRQALDEYEANKQYRKASTVSTDLSRLLRTKGKYDDSLKMLEKALQMKIELNDVRGIADAKINIVVLLLAQGYLVEARNELVDVVSYVAENNVQGRDNYLDKLDIYIDFYEKKYQSVLDKKALMAKDYKSRTLDMMAMKSRMALGNTTEMKQWLAEYSNYKSGTNNNLRMYWLDMESHYLEHFGSKEELIRSYKERIDLTHSLERYTSSTKTRIKLAYVYLEQKKQDEVEQLLNAIRIHQFDFWEIKLLEGVFAFNKGEIEQAKKLVQEAKNQSTEYWTEQNELNYLQVINF